MKIKEFFLYIWIAQELTGLLFVSLGMLVVGNFVQITNPEDFIQLMVNLTYITIIVNIISYIGLVVFDFSSFETTGEHGTDATGEIILLTFGLGFVCYVLMIIPILIWIGIFKALELVEIGFNRLLGLTGIYYLEIGFVLLFIGVIFFIVWFYARLTTVFELTIIKRNKKTGESKE